jgi:Ca2+-transporting ATPase
MDLNLDRARTLTFTVMVLAQLFHALNNRSENRSIFALGLWTNKPLLATVGLSALLQAGIVSWPSVQSLFKVAPFDPEHWVLAIGIGMLPLVAMEIWKVAKKNVDR